MGWPWAGSRYSGRCRALTIKSEPAPGQAQGRGGGRLWASLLTRPCPHRIVMGSHSDSIVRAPCGGPVAMTRASTPQGLWQYVHHCYTSPSSREEDDGVAQTRTPSARQPTCTPTYTPTHLRTRDRPLSSGYIKPTPAPCPLSVLQVWLDSFFSHFTFITYSSVFTQRLSLSVSCTLSTLAHIEHHYDPPEPAAASSSTAFPGVCFLSLASSKRNAAQHSTAPRRLHRQRRPPPPRPRPRPHYLPTYLPYLTYLDTPAPHCTL